MGVRHTAKGAIGLTLVGAIGLRRRCDRCHDVGAIVVTTSVRSFFDVGATNLPSVLADDVECLAQ